MNTLVKGYIRGCYYELQTLLEKVSKSCTGDQLPNEKYTLKAEDLDDHSGQTEPKAPWAGELFVE